LIQRKDDTAEVLKKRLSSFHEQTTPVRLNFALHLSFFKNGELVSGKVFVFTLAMQIGTESMGDF
jgi:hypothetical protein